MSAARPGYIAILLSFLVALMLTALPMPAWAALWRPAWVALVLIYWCMAAPAYAGVVMGWALGLFMDVLVGSLLGQHALALAIVAFVAHRFHRQVRVLPIWQQGVSVFGLVFIYQALVLWITGIQGMPTQSNYSAAKAGVIGFTKALAKELGPHGITVNVIAPFAMTRLLENAPKDFLALWIEKTALKRVGEPVEVANLILFLASDESSYVTGQLINVDGGLSIG